MKSAIAASTILAMAPAVFAQSLPFSLMSVRSASPIHFGSVNANGGTFWIGKPTSTYCPEVVGSACPNATEVQTAFVGGEDTLSMDTTVPGGQQVYVAPSGILSFTQAHSAYVPTGSVRTGFVKSEGEQFGHLSFTGGLVACPTGENGTNGFPYQIYGQIEGVVLPAGCLGFDALTINSTAPRAWQYA